MAVVECYCLLKGVYKNSMQGKKKFRAIGQRHCRNARKNGSSEVESFCDRTNHGLLTDKGSKMAAYIRRCILKILKIYFHFGMKITSLGGEGALKHVFDYICMYEEKYSRYYVAYNRWPKSVNRIENIVNEYISVQDNHIAIIVTGLLIEKDDFTFNTILLYRKLYPNVKIIYSTWNDQNKEVLNKIEKIDDVYVITTQVPIESGVGHINYQIKSAQVGIEFARKLGVKYVLRTRSDVRIYRKRVLEYMHNILLKYEVCSPFQDRRIITMSGRCGTMNVFYVLCDFLTFGTLDDMAKLYSISLDMRKVSSDTLKGYDYQELTKCRYTAESFLFKGYLDEIIRDTSFEMNYEDYYKAVRDYFIVLDEDLFQAYWYKYESRFEWNRGRSYEFQNEANFDNVYWTLMQKENR